jgi:hypothetical protein
MFKGSYDSVYYNFREGSRSKYLAFSSFQGLTRGGIFCPAG